MRYWKIALLAVFCGASAVSLAENPERNWRADVELGYVNTSGNSKTESVKTRSTFKYKVNQWNYDAEFEAFNAKSEGTRTAESYFFANRLTYDFSPNNYIFAYSSYEDNRFSGFDYKVTGALGYGRRLIDREHMSWDAEVGPGFRRSVVTDDTQGEEDSDEVIVRGASQFFWEFSPSARFEQRVSVESGNDSTVTRSTSALSSTLIGNVAMKLSYIITYTDNVPRDKKHADTQTALTLVYTF